MVETSPTGLRMGPKVGSKCWVLRLDHKVRYQDWALKVMSKVSVASEGWVLSLVPRLGTEFGCLGWVPRLCPNMGSKVGFQSWVPKLSPKMDPFNSLFVVNCCSF